MPYLGKVELKSSNIKRWTGVPGAVSAITHSTMGFVPFNEPSTFITVNGVGQHNSAFSLSPSQIDFSSAFDVLDEVEVTCIIDVGQPISSANDTVGIPQLQTTDGTAGQVLTTDGSGNLSFSSKSVETLASMGVTSSTGELNILDGVTSTAAELNILDGVTSTAAELNILDGVTSTAAELNILDGVTSTAAELNILDGVTSTAAELNILDGVTSVGYLNIPKSGASKTASYTLATSDIGELIEVGASGAITIPDATFSTGDVILIFNNTSGDVTITCSITTSYIGGTDADDASITLATRGICNVLFISGTVCVVTGNVT
jgi:hypothetical protein